MQSTCSHLPRATLCTTSRVGIQIHRCTLCACDSHMKKPSQVHGMVTWRGMSQDVSESGCLSHTWVEERGGCCQQMCEAHPQSAQVAGHIKGLSGICRAAPRWRHEYCIRLPQHTTLGEPNPRLALGAAALSVLLLGDGKLAPKQTMEPFLRSDLHIFQWKRGWHTRRPAGSEKKSAQRRSRRPATP